MEWKISAKRNFDKKQGKYVGWRESTEFSELVQNMVILYILCLVKMQLALGQFTPIMEHG